MTEQERTAELARLGVELATKGKAIRDRHAAGFLVDDLIKDCDALRTTILALTAPAEREPMPWPRAVNDPEIEQSKIGLGWFVRQYTGIGWNVVGPVCPTRTAAIDAWDEVMKRLAGTGLSREHRSWIATAIRCLRDECCDQNADRLQRILDAHPDGGGA